MKIKNYKQESFIERQILAAMLRRPEVIGKIAPKWSSGLFLAPEHNRLASWAVAAWLAHGKPLRRGALVKLEELSKGHDSPEQLEGLEKVIGVILAETIQANPQQIVDAAAKHFRYVKATKLNESLSAAIDANQIDKAEELIAGHSRLEMGEEEAESVLTDPACFQELFNQQRNEILIPYSGAAGQFFADRLELGGLISIVAPEKSGKSFMLLDMGIRAAFNRKRVAFFDCGDMSKDQIKERIAARITKRVFRSPDGKYPIKIGWPTEIQFENDGTNVIAKSLQFDKPLSFGSIERAIERLKQQKMKSNRTFFKLACRSSGTFSVADLRGILSTWATEGWLPEILIIDYSDIMAPMNRKLDKLEQINETWMALRALSLDLHILVVTATQTTREGYKAKSIRMEHTSNDKRKNATATALIGLSCTDEEREIGLRRINWSNARRGHYDSRKACYLATCLSLANPCVLSAWKPRKES